ncbi:MAG: hypothetical protein KGI28_10760, partial [Thaumarchaeota archaeon]|nr:hypothetical protein [Nitrososphaerota archaeon]
ETTGNLEYQDKSANMKFHSDKISFLSVISTSSEATIVGTTNDDMQDKSGTQGSNHTFLATISDPDKTGNHDTFSIVVTGSTGNVVYQKSGTVQGHIEIHKINNEEDHKNDNHQDNNDHHDNNSG